MRTKLLTVCAGGWLLAGAVAGGTITCRLELDREALPADRPERVVLRLTVEAPRPEANQRPPVNLSVVLDRSGSMSGTRMEQAREAALIALGKLSPRDRFSLVAFDSTVETIIPSQHVKDRRSMETRIRGIRAGGMTALFGGVSQGAAEVRKHLDDEYIHRVILLSDGKANVGPSSPEDLGRLAGAFRKEGISVSTVGLGLGYNEDLMLQMAQASDGNSYFVEGAEELPRIFAAELGDVFDVMARDLRIIITLPDGIRPIRIIGRDGRVQANRIELEMAQVYGGQPRYVLFEVEVPATPEGRRLPVARAEVNMIQATDGKSLQLNAEASARFTRDAREVEESLNAAVARDTAVNIRAEYQKRAVEEMDADRPQEAGSNLRRAAARLRAVGGRLQDEALLEEAESLEVQADDISSRGTLAPAARKNIMTESYQTIQQQRNR